ncbi:MAG: AraC family transcriptional regulator, partial [Gemmatimonadota bacterium]|nr:AraC family transcriptional regulator [Gemmatimonadota bacterium]
LLTRPPRPVLRAFVKTPWASDQTGETLPAIADRERVLTTGMMHLVARLPTVRGLHPVVAHALERFSETDLVRDVVSETGYSHRRFIQLFLRAVGLKPKVFCRIIRFQRMLERLDRSPSSSWAGLALNSGYSDQAHFNREFREFAGVSPSQYRDAAPAFPNHVPVRG